MTIRPGEEIHGVPEDPAQAQAAHPLQDARLTGSAS